MVSFSAKAVPPRCAKARNTIRDGIAPTVLGPLSSVAKADSAHHRRSASPPYNKRLK